MHKSAKLTSKALALLLVVVVLLGAFPTSAIASDDPLSGTTGSGWDDFGGEYVEGGIGEIVDGNKSGSAIGSSPTFDEEGGEDGEAEGQDGIINAEDLETADDNIYGEEESASSGVDNTGTEGVTDADIGGIEETPFATPSVASSGDIEFVDTWIQEYQEWAMNYRPARTRAAGGSPTYSSITWGSDTPVDRITFSNGAYINSPLPRITFNGQAAFCYEWNGQDPTGTYTEQGAGTNSSVKKYLAAYLASPSEKAYIATQVLIWSELMGQSVSSWGSSGAGSAASSIAGYSGSVEYTVFSGPTAMSMIPLLPSLTL